MKKITEFFLCLLVIVISAVSIYYGNIYLNSKTNSGTIYDKETELDEMVFATILSINEDIATDKIESSGQEIMFTAKTFGSTKSEIVRGIQILDESAENTIAVSVGDKVVLMTYGDDDLLFQYYFRFDKVVILALVFIVLILIMGRIKGFKTIISLALTCLSIFFIFIPSIGVGINIYFSTTIISFYIILMTLVIVYGLNKKSLIAALSCILGVLFAGILTNIMDYWMKLTGYINDDMYLLSSLFGIEIDVKAILYSMIIIGALGAIMDVSISIASSLNELQENNKRISTRDLLKSGFSIGRDIMGTMANTLLMAYIGSSLVVVLIYAASNYTLLSLLNKEEIIFEFLQSLVGSLSLLLTIPLTTVIASTILTKREH